MTKLRTADADDLARPASGPRRRRRIVGRPPTGAVAAVGVGLLLLVAAGQAVAPRASESGAGELAYALWLNPVPSFLAMTGRGTTAPARGLVPADPPRALGVPDTRAPAGKSGGAAGASGGASSDPSGAVRAAGPGRQSGATTAASNANGGGGAATASLAAVARATASPTTGIPIRVYFSRYPDSDATFTAVSPVTRTAPDRGVAAAALAELIEGPTTEERAAGYFSELGASLRGPSICHGRDFRLSIVDGVATVRFCRSMTSAGIGQDARVRAQIEATLTQFSSIRSVRLLGSDGHCLFDQSGLDRCLAGAAPAARTFGAP